MKTLHKIILPVSLGALGLVIFNSFSVRIPRGATAVKNFDIQKYLGRWYEIARFDYRFEKIWIMLRLNIQKIRTVLSR
jgi:apolipoprotein D and lipocalin family protein